MIEHKVNYITKCIGCGNTRTTQITFTNEYWEKGIRLGATRKILSSETGTDEQKEEALAKLFGPASYSFKVTQGKMELIEDANPS